MGIPTDIIDELGLFKDTVHEHIRLWPNGFRQHGWLFSRKKTF